MTTIKVSKIYDALVEFCVQQSNGRVGIERINAVVADGLRMIMKCPSPRFYSEKVLSYTVIIDGKKMDELLYNDMHDNSVICPEGIWLGSFLIDDDSYIERGDTILFTGYDIIYDPAADEIVLLYIVAADTDGDSDITTVYRVRTDMFEDFSLEGFVYGLAAQICTRLIKAHENKNKGV
ncbi:MAG: hypothetical protein J6O50_00935 [Ruminiclostridium sp.]|nr:hypothetical protein [Ruminiclostridium sp.]